MNIKFYFFILLFVAGLSGHAQTIRGLVQDSTQSVSGATVSVSGLKQRAGTDANGRYEIKLPAAGTYQIFVSYIGYQIAQKSITISAGETKDLDFVLSTSTGNNLEGVVVLGSRSAPRSRLETPVPVDVVDIKRLTQNVAQVSLNQLLNFVAPSFTSNVVSLVDGTDHIDPASLRGLGPDQVLVLVNGKRRHTRYHSRQM
jgi:iron complex outermembrane receptor protein